MAKRRKRSIDKFLDVQPAMLLEAIVLEQQRYHFEDKDPGSDKWLLPGRFNDEMMHDVEHRWNAIYCENTGEDEPPDFFPYTVGHVSSLWVRFRKDSNHAKADIHAELNVPLLSNEEQPVV